MGDLEKGIDTRFVHACHLLKTRPTDAGVEDAFKILYAMDRGERHWSYVIDVRNRKVYVETRSEKQRRFLDLGALDFSSAGPTQLLDIHLDQAGDVTACLQPATLEANRQVAQKIIAWSNSIAGPEHVIDSYEKQGLPVPELYQKGSPETLLKSICSYAERVQSESKA